MKIIKIKYQPLIIFLILGFAFNSGHAQQDFYKKHLVKGKSYYYQDPPKYAEALKEFSLAKNYLSPNDKAKLDTINAWDNKTRDAIVRLYEISEAQRAKALMEKRNAEIARREAEKERLIAQRALEKTTRIINAFYFYEEQFALANKYNKFGFINKDGDVVIDYKYDEADPFDYTGLARVKRGDQYYLIDNKKVEYELSTNSLILPSTESLDLSNMQLLDFPESITNSAQLKILLINNNEIRKISPRISNMSNLRRLYFYNNDLESLPASLGALSNLKLLDLGINTLSELPPEIGSLSKLTDLYLYDNSLLKIPVEIGKLNNLFFLDLSQNLLSELPGEFKDLKGLRILALGDNLFGEVPLPLRDLPEIRMLDLGGNQIETLPDWIGSYASLTHLHVRDNGLKNLPASIQNLDSIKEFIADNNQFSNLPEEFGKLYSLEVLDLSYNSFSTIPPEILELSNLRDLYLNGNSIQTLPAQLSTLASLRKVDISDNQLIALPENVSGVENLEELVLMNNRLTILPRGISKLQALKIIDIRGNPEMDLAKSMRNLGSSNKQIIISAGANNLENLVEENRFLINIDPLNVLPPELAGLKKLVLLDLTSCFDLVSSEIESTFNDYTRDIYYSNSDFPQIADTNGLLINVDLPLLLELDPEQMQARTELDLSGYAMTTLPEEIGQLTNLEFLELSNNKLQYLPEEIGKLVKLKELNLDGNEITSLPEEAIMKLKNLEKVSLMRNPITNETLEILRDWLPENCQVKVDEDI